MEELHKHAREFADDLVWRRVWPRHDTALRDFEQGDVVFQTQVESDIAKGLRHAEDAGTKRTHLLAIRAVAVPPEDP